METPNQLEELANQVVNALRASAEDPHIKQRGSLGSTVSALFRPYLLKACDGVVPQGRPLPEEDKRFRKWKMSCVWYQHGRIQAMSDGREHHSVTNEVRRVGGEWCTGLEGIADKLMEYAVAVLPPTLLQHPEFCRARIMKRLENLRPTISRDHGYACLRVVVEPWWLEVDIYREDNAPMDGPTRDETIRALRRMPSEQPAATPEENLCAVNPALGEGC